MILIRKRVICYIAICLLLFTLVGCGNKQEDNSQKIKIDDVKISQPDTTYYTKGQDGDFYPCDDAILITSNNEYKCVDTDIEWNEELRIYTCTIKFKNIIEKQKGE